MAKLKLTKTELKAQMDDLKRFNRFLPTLQLKKQQLQLEIRKSQSLFEENERKFKELRARLSRWTALLGDENIVSPVIIFGYRHPSRTSSSVPDDDSLLSKLVPILGNLRNMTKCHAARLICWASPICRSRCS